MRRVRPAAFSGDSIVLGSTLENDGCFRFLMAPLVVDKVAQPEMFIPSWPSERALLKEEAGSVGHLNRERVSRDNRL